MFDCQLDDMPGTEGDFPLVTSVNVSDKCAQFLVYKWLFCLRAANGMISIRLLLVQVHAVCHEFPSSSSVATVQVYYSVWAICNQTEEWSSETLVEDKQL